MNISRYLGVFVFLVPFVVWPCMLNAQDDSTAFTIKENDMPYEVVKSNPAAWLVGPTVICSEFGLNYEFSLSKNRSLSIGASALTKNVFIFLAEKLDTTGINGGNIVQVSPKLKISGFRVQAQYKFLLPLYDYPNALYIGPHASYSTVLFSYRQRGFTTDFYKITHNNVSLLIGYQHCLAGKFFFDLYMGLGYKYNTVMYYKSLNNFKKEDNEFIFTGIPLPIKFSLGYYVGYKF